MNLEKKSKALVLHGLVGFSVDFKANVVPLFEVPGHTSVTQKVPNADYILSEQF